MIMKKLAAPLKCYWAANDPMIAAKFEIKPFDLFVVQATPLTAQALNQEIEDFYQSLKEVMQKSKSRDIKIIMAHSNAKVGAGESGYAVGKHGLGERNDRGTPLADSAEENNMIVSNAWPKNEDTY